MRPSPSVLVVLTETYSVLGGLQRFNRRLIAALLAAAGQGELASVQALVLRDTPEHVPTELHGTVSAQKSRGALIRALWARAGKVDLLILGHIHLLPLAMMAKLRRPGIRIMLMAHGVEVWDRPSYRRRRWFEPALLRLVDRIGSVSVYTTRQMAEAYSVEDSKFCLLPNAVNMAGEPAPWPRLPVVLCVTRMARHDRRKNVDALIRAFAAVHSAMPEARLWIVGDGELRTELEALAETLGLETVVRFLGQVDEAALETAYRSAGVFVLPSAKEGFGVVFLEAWLHGLPVICGTEDGAREIIDEGVDGFAVAPSDLGALAQRMLDLLCDPNRARTMGLTGRSKIEKRYSDNVFRKNLPALIEDTMR